MKLRTLELVKFGPFTGRTLHFGGGGAGLGVVYGKNEAGKSTARRAVLGLLFGVPDATRDAHLHAPADLAVSAEFVGPDATRVKLTRRKKRKDSLRDAADVPVAEAAMTELLGGIERPLYAQLFCFGHEELKEGGQALLDGKGDAGQSLFDAGAGGAGIHRVLARLDAEAEELYLAKGRKPKLNQALERYRDDSRALKQSLQLPEDWQKQKRALDDLRTHRVTLDARRDELRREQQRFARIQRALPIAVRYAEIGAARRALGTLPALPDDAGQRRRRALDVLRDAQRDLAERAHRIARRSGERNELSVDDAVLGAGAARMHALADDLAVNRKAEGDLRKRLGEKSAAEADARTVLARLGRSTSLDGVETLRIGVADRRRIDELGRRGSEIQGRLAELERRHAQSADALARLVTDVEPAAAEPDPEPLRRAVAKAQRAGDLDARHREVTLELAEIEPALALALGRLAPWTGDAAELASLALPTRETTQSFDLAEQRLSERGSQLAESIEAARAEVSAIERAIAALESGGAVPDERQLDDARRHRDSGWVLVRRAWQEGGDVQADAARFDPVRPLAEAYARAVGAADEISDRLRREAKRVAELAEKRQALEQAGAAVREIEGKLAALTHERARLSSSWADVLRPLGLEQRSPALLRDWLGRAEAVGALWERRERARRLRATIESERAPLIARLSELCSDVAPESLSDALDAAEAMLALLDAAQGRREARRRERARLEETTHQLASERDAAREERARWQRDWARAVAALSLDADATPVQVAAVLGELESLFAALDRANASAARCATIERDQRAFAQRVNDLVARHAPDLASDDALGAAERLVARFDTAERAAAERARLDAELGTLEEERELLDADARRARSELDELAAAAGVSEDAELANVEERVRRAAELDAELTKAERELRRIAEQHGLGLEALCAETAGADAAAVQARLEALEAELDEVNEQREAARQQIASVEAGLERYRAETGAEAAQRRESSAAEVIEHAHQYARLRVAAIVLRRRIDLYREKNQDPIVTRASALFHELTLGAFRGLRIGLEQRVIYCVRSDGNEIEVDALSEGTRFQLYFALRIASLERHLESSQPLPLLLDDTFIHFDDERMLAAFRVLGQLAKRIQVIYFTHHHHHLELARRAVPDALIEQDLSTDASVQLELLPVQ